MPKTPAPADYPDPSAIFTGVAHAYVRYRPEHPATLIDHIAHAARGHASQAPVLDLGCGPGAVALRLAQRGLPVLAVDPNPEMVAAGRDLACDSYPTSGGVEWRIGDAALVSTLPTVRGTVIADAFHYMDREQTLIDLDMITAPGGWLAVIVSHAIGTPKPWWEPVLDRLRDHHLGRHRAAGPDTLFRYLVEDHETVLRRSPFSRIRVLRADYDLDLTLEEIVGLQHTYAFSSLPVLGERRESFEQAIRDTLTAMEPSCRFTATVQGAAIIGERP